MGTVEAPHHPACYYDINNFDINIDKLDDFNDEFDNDSTIKNGKQYE